MLATTALLLLTLRADDPPAPPSEAELAAITDRGRRLAGYDSAAWHATDAVLALSPAPGAIQRYIAQKTDRGWIVAFGRLDKGRDKFLVTYEATEAGRERYDARKIDPPRASTGFERLAALAMDEAMTDFLKSNTERRPYNIAAIPADLGKLWVYLVPAPTKPGVWPLGGDVRYLVSAGAPKILEKRILHKAIIELDPPKEGPDARPVAGVHNHVLSNTPEDTDVLHVLSREPRRPEVVVTKDYVFGVKEDGAIDFLGTAKDVLKK